MTWSMFDVCQPCCQEPDPCTLPGNRVLIYSRTEQNPQDYSELASLYENCDWYGPGDPLPDNFSIDSYKVIFIMRPTTLESAFTTKLLAWLGKGNRRLVFAGDEGSASLSANQFIALFLFGHSAYGIGYSPFTNLGAGLGCDQEQSVVFQTHPLTRGLRNWQNDGAASVTAGTPSTGVSVYRLTQRFQNNFNSATMYLSNFSVCGGTYCSELIVSGDTGCFGAGCAIKEDNEVFLKRLVDDDVECKPCWVHLVRIHSSGFDDGPPPFTVLFEIDGEMYLMNYIHSSLISGVSGWHSNPLNAPAGSCFGLSSYPFYRIAVSVSDGQMDLDFFPPCSTVSTDSVSIEYDCSSPPASVEIGGGTLYFLEANCGGHDLGVIVGGCEPRWPSILFMTSNVVEIGLAAYLIYAGESGWEGFIKNLGSFTDIGRYLRLWQEDGVWKLSVGTSPRSTDVYLGEASSVSCCPLELSFEGSGLLDEISITPAVFSGFGYT